MNNSQTMFKFESVLTPEEVSVLISLLTSGADIEHLDLYEPPTGTGAALGKAIKCSGKLSYLAVRNLSGPIDSEVPQLLLVSHNAVLEQLEIYRLVIGNKCMSSLTQFARLRKFTMNCCYFDVALLAECITRLKALESLTISVMTFHPSTTKALAVALMKLPMITDLDLCCILIDMEGWQQFGRSFLGKLHNLDLRKNDLDDKLISVIVNAILASCGQRGCKLQKLCLDSNSITPAGALKVSELAACSPHLRRLDLGKNPIADWIVPQALQGCANSLHELDAGECKLCPRGIAALLASDFRVLTTLSISCNRSGDLGATAVAQFLLHHGGHTLKALYMDQNEIEEAGALELAKGFAKAYALKSIDVHMNQFSHRGAAAVLDALATASTAPMDKIDFSDCEVGDHGAEEVGRLIRCRGCGYVILNGNKIEARGIKVIADSIGSSAVMTSILKLSANTSGNEGITYLINQIARKNDSVRELCLHSSDIDAEGAMAIKRAMEVRGALSEIMFCGLVKDIHVRIILDEAEKVSRGEGYAKLVNWGPDN